MSDPPLLDATDVAVRLGAKKRLIRKDIPGFPVLTGINLQLAAGEIVGLVGESGSGKTTLGRAIVGLTDLHAGSIRFNGTELAGLSRRQWYPHRRQLQFIFQDPLASLNPRLTVGHSLAAPLRRLGGPDHRLLGDRVDELLGEVGLPVEFRRRFPHQLSGGQRQRVGIARALAIRPQLIIADEVVSGLDVSSQALILRLLKTLRAEHGITILFITHDLSVVRRFADRVVVMSNGRIRESGTVADVFAAPRHTYTRRLLSAIPEPVPDEGWLESTAEGMNPMKIAGAVALVTGANRGIGRRLVDELLERGAGRIYAGARDPAEVARLDALDDRVIGLRLDITDPVQVSAAAGKASDVTLLINNAGYNSNSGAIASDSLEEAHREMDVNYFGTLRMIRAFSDVLRKNDGGAIINMLSVLSRVALPLMGTLCASKAAGLSMTQAVRGELAAQGTRVLAVMPGAVDTDMSKDFPPPKMDPADVARAALNALEAGEEEVYPGDMAQGLAAGLEHDPKAIERDLAQYLP